MCAASTWPYPQWIAHRGAGKRAPENTMAAFELGASLGYRMFECDVQVSSDGVPFLLHDDNLDRTTNGTGLACAHTWAQLSALDAGAWLGADHAGSQIPSLDEIGRFCRERGLLLNLEIKPSAGQEIRCGETLARVVARDWSHQAIKPLLSSFQIESLIAARHAAPELPRALLLDALSPSSLQTAVSLQCVAVVMEQSLWTAALVAQTHTLGMKAMSYTVNDPDKARQLLVWGCDALISDRLGAQG